jgi:hypothetical protein
MPVVLLEIDEEFQVAVARALVESPHCALVAAADPNSKAGHIAAADSYDEAVEFAQEHIQRGWRAVVWEVPTHRR